MKRVTVDNAMDILITCESSGTIREALRRKGHNAISNDILAADDGSSHHIQGDGREVANSRNWDMIIAHPPCTYLTNASNKWLASTKPMAGYEWDETYGVYINWARFAKMQEGAAFFKFFLDHSCPKKCIENPIMHRFAMEAIGGVKPSQTVQPYEFGDDASKRTCLWLTGLPLLQKTTYCEPKLVEYKGRIVKRWSNQSPCGSNKYGPSPERWKLRSKTFQGIADAIADQWGTIAVPTTPEVTFLDRQLF